MFDAHCILIVLYLRNTNRPLYIIILRTFVISVMHLLESLKTRQRNNDSTVKCGVINCAHTHTDLSDKQHFKFSSVSKYTTVDCVVCIQSSMWLPWSTQWLVLVHLQFIACCTDDCRACCQCELLYAVLPCFIVWPRCDLAILYYSIICMIAPNVIVLQCKLCDNRLSTAVCDNIGLVWKSAARE